MDVVDVDVWSCVGRRGRKGKKGIGKTANASLRLLAWKLQLPNPTLATNC